MKESNTLLNIFSKEVVSNHYLITLNDEIGSASEYSELIALLKFANENDVVEIEINNNGGSVDTALQIKNAISECKANVITCLNVAAHSAASVVMLAGHSYKIGKYASMVIHEGFSGLSGKPSDIRKHIDFYNRQLDRIVTEVYSEILTEDEIKSVLNGLELILDDVELMKRLNNRKTGERDFSKMLNTDLTDLFKSVLDKYQGKKLTESSIAEAASELANEAVILLTECNEE